MGTITELAHIDFIYVFVSIYVILAGAKEVIPLFEWMIGKLGLETKWMRKRKEEQKLLAKTSQNLTTLYEQHENDIKKLNEYDEAIHKELTSFISEIRNSILETQQEIKSLAENRIHDREQSRQIQKELSDSIKSIVDRNIEKDKQMNNLMISQKEMMADKINEKYKYYVSIKGIPEDELDEFASLHTAYKAIGGNHTGDAKYEYCINHLEIIPVKTNLVINNE